MPTLGRKAVPPPAPKKPKGPPNLALLNKRAKHADAMLLKAQKRLKTATTVLVRWQKRVRYYQARLALHGQHSWELDALDPETLAEIVREAFETVLDREAMDEVIAEEESDKARLREALEHLEEA